MTSPTVISTFAGCGGSSLGYKLAGFRELLAVEWDDNAVETFRLNFPGVPVFHGDIATLSGAECMRLAGVAVGELDVLDGSPPCQGFSTAGARKFDDPRNSLFKEFARLVREIQPKVFVMENVTGMIKGVMKQAYLVIVQTLRDCGYVVRGEVLNAMYFNVPQSRERVILVGVRKDLGIEPSHPKPRSKPLGLQDALGLRRGWGRLGDGVKNKQFNNNFRSLKLPCVTLEKTRPPILNIAGVEREMTLDECSIIASFPKDFVWGKRGYSGIGNCVPPNLMRAVAEHIRENILDRIA